jgi:hypothetical protein
MTLAELKTNNPHWFNPENRRIFGDLGYGLKTGKKSGSQFLVQKTNKWSDMFEKDKKRIFFVLHPIVNGKIESAIEEDFFSIKEVKQYLRDK